MIPRNLPTFWHCLAGAMLIINSLTGLFASEAMPPRERLSFDRDWRFALGHASDVSKDFNHATGGFSYFAKAGFGSGASDPKFDDRGWRKLNLPHDWAAELPFSERGSGSHGFKAIGRSFPENSVGRYRKTFHIPKSDLGKRISFEFDGVFRDSIVWVNGHYLGTEQSGYSSFARNLSEILNYGGDKDGKETLTTKIETTDTPATIQLAPHRATIKADGADVSVITVQVNDAQGQIDPTAANEISFSVSGPGKIIGVGNGDPRRMNRINSWKRTARPRPSGSAACSTASPKSSCNLLARAAKLR